MDLVRLMNTSLGSSIVGAVVGFLLSRLPSRNANSTIVQVTGGSALRVAAAGDVVIHGRFIEAPKRRGSSHGGGGSGDALFLAIVATLIGTATLVWMIARGWQIFSILVPAITGVISMLIVAMARRYPFVRGGRLLTVAALVSALGLILTVRLLGETPKGLVSFAQVANETVGLGLAGGIEKTMALLKLQGLEMYAIRLGFVCLAGITFLFILIRAIGGWIAPSTDRTSWGSFLSRRSGALTGRRPFEVGDAWAGIILSVISVVGSSSLVTQLLWDRLNK